MRTVSTQLFSEFYFSEQQFLNTGCSEVFFHFYLLHFTIWLYFNRSLCIFIRKLITVLKFLYSKIPLFQCKRMLLAMMEKHIVLQAALHDSFSFTDGAGSRRAGRCRENEEAPALRQCPGAAGERALGSGGAVLPGRARRGRSHRPRPATGAAGRGSHGPQPL